MPTLARSACSTRSVERAHRPRESAGTGLTQRGHGPRAGRGDCASTYAPAAPPAVIFRAGLAAVSRRGCVIPERAYGCRRDHQRPLCIHLLLRRSRLHPTRLPASSGDRARFSNKLQAQQHLRLRYFQYSLTDDSHTPAGNGCTPCRAWSGREFGSAVASCDESTAADGGETRQ